MCMFCRSLFVLLYFFFWPLCCLFFFDIRFLITPLVSSNSSSKIKYRSRRKRQNWHPPLTHKYMTAHLCGLVQRKLIIQHKQRCSSGFFREVKVDHLSNFLCHVFVRLCSPSCTLYFLCLWIVHSWLTLRFFSHVVYVQGSVSSITSQ